MAIEWKDAIGEVAKYAPAVATALGGPGVGGIAAGAAQMVSGMLGIDNGPASFVAATKNPEMLAKLQQINNDHERELLSLRLQAEQAAAAEKTKQMTEVNATIRAELGTEGWFKSGWRPAIGWVMALSFAVMSGAMAYALIIDPSQLPSIMDGIITLIVAMGTVLGVNINARTTEKHLEQTGTKPMSFMDAIKTRVAK